MSRNYSRSHSREHYPPSQHSSHKSSSNKHSRRGRMDDPRDRGDERMDYQPSDSSASSSSSRSQQSPTYQGSNPPWAANQDPYHGALEDKRAAMEISRYEDQQRHQAQEQRFRSQQAAKSGGCAYQDCNPPWAANQDPYHGALEDKRAAMEISRYEDQQRHQAQEQRFRSQQASTQMLYNVYEHTVGMIEELEKHDEVPTENSGLMSHIFPQGYKKPKHDLTAVIEAELTCLRAQMKFAPPEVIQQTKDELLNRTLRWSAKREGLPIGLVDKYAKNVAQLLTEGSMTLPPREKGPKTELSERDVQDALYRYGAARHEGDLQDKQFHDNPNKKAALRAMRLGKHTYIGARRLLEVDRSDRAFKEALIKHGFDTESLK
ncbi:predicted protein [Nematostella vectensis]|uniref:Uncharacterized protein n=1 Tax=Nematostella vectensis TaxID=45351 RepID=A7SJY6_NEMVE|nr:predicted protein [Nematostella vectensis]|eukprot:XP_001628025.1 predicted protein [Nematostella vectensis]